MRYLLYILVLIIAITSCKSKDAEPKSDTQLKEWKVRSCKMYSSDFVLIDPEDKGQLIQEFRFNRKGFVNELIRYGLDGEIIGRFDILGEHTPFPMPGKPQYVDTVLTVVDIDSLGNTNGKEIKVYNGAGLLIDVKYFEGDNQLLKHNTYKYDNQGMILEDIYWDVELGKPKQKIRYEFEYFTD